MSAFARLRNGVTALAVTMLGMVVVTGPASAVDGELPPDFYLCHATGNASSVEDVKNWVYSRPADSGQAQGHADDDHQTSNDIIPPVPGVLPDGWNWTTYGQQVHANGCAIPTYVDAAVTFTDQLCAQQAYVPPTMSAPEYAGITRTVTGAGDDGTPDPGETITVTYQGTTSHIINGADATGTISFTHAYPAEPDGAQECVPQPEPLVDHRTDTTKTCAEGVRTRSWDVVTPFVWDDASDRWIEGATTVANDTGYVFVRDLTVAEKNELDCPRPPQPDAVVVPKSEERSSCEAGVETRAWDEVTPYVFDQATFSWVTGAMEVQNESAWEFTRPLNAEEKAELDCPRPLQPEALVVEKSDERSTCANGFEIRSWNDVTPYVWDHATYDWVLGSVQVQDDTGWVFDRELTAAEKVELDCPKPPQPDDVVVPKSADQPSCEAGVVTRTWNEVTPYVFDPTTYTWVLGSMQVEDDSDWLFSRPLTAAEKAELDCPQPPQPEAAVVSMTDDRSSCAMGVEARSWNEVTPYVFDQATYDWVLGTMQEQDDTGWVFSRGLTAAEKAELDCPQPPQPEDVVTAADQERESCRLGGRETWTETTTVGWTFDEAIWEWTELEPVTTATLPVLTPYTPHQAGQLCPIDIEGEEETDRDPKDDVEVKGAQAPSPAVPTVVDAGIESVPGTTPATPRSSGGPWALALGSGLLLIGFAGTRRRPDLG